MNKRCDDGSGRIAGLIVRSAIPMLGSNGECDFACNVVHAHGGPQNRGQNHRMASGRWYFPCAALAVYWEPSDGRASGPVLQ